MVQIRTIVLVVVVVSLVAIGASDCIDPRKGTPVEITLLHTNDIHSHLRAEPAGTEKNPYGLGGLARLKTLIDQKRTQKQNTLLLDAGDWSEGAVHFDIDAGSNILRIFQAMGYDATVVGNHDFLNGAVELALTVERAEPTFPVLGANRDVSQLSAADQSKFNQWIKDYVILNAGPVKVAVIGLLTDELFYYDYFKPGRITNMIEKASELTRKIHDNGLADVIVLLSHNAFYTNVQLARTVPWVNVVISGHSHAKTSTPVVQTNAGQPVYVVEAKSWGQFLGEMTLTVDKTRKQVRLKSYQLNPVYSSLPEHAGIAALVDQEDNRLKARYGADFFTGHVADCTDEMIHSETRELPLSNLVADSYRFAVGTDLGIESAPLVGVGLNPGKLSNFDLRNAQPHTFMPFRDKEGVLLKPFPEYGHVWTIHKLNLSGSDLWMLLNFVLLGNMKGNLGLGWLSISGAKVYYTNSPDSINPLRKIEVFDTVTRQYKPLQFEKTYSLAFNDGVLMSLKIMKSIGLNIDPSRTVDTSIEVFTAFHSFIQSQGGVIGNHASYDVGSRFYSLESDLGVYEHKTELKNKDGKNYLEITVQNFGLASSPVGAKLRVLRSKPNDAVGDFTNDNENVLISQPVALPSLNPGASTKLEVPWENSLGSGIYSLRIEVVYENPGSDANPVNDFVVIHKSL